MMATALSSVTLRTDTDSSIMRRYDLQLIRSQTRATYLAAASSKLLAAFGIDFINQFLPRIPTIPNFTPGLSTVFSEFEILPDLSFRYLDGTWSGTGGVVQGPRLWEYFSDLSMAVFENYAYVFWSTVLSDLGVSSKPNILTDVDLFHQIIHSNLSPSRNIRDMDKWHRRGLCIERHNLVPLAIQRRPVNFIQRTIYLPESRLERAR
ncbi:hypothetical protein FRC09_008277 [Ceratobasidium sp. 395]|nr:hypothetical protein FRC09_008277 [Ceratobasidium sp. 395]